MSSHRQKIAAALMKMHNTVEASPVYANAVADVLIALTAPQLEEAHKQTALLQELVAQGKQAAGSNRIIINGYGHQQHDASGLPG